nr:hypothetical protein [Bacilli bacterium]
MKIFTNNKVYVSRHDIVFLLKERYSMPYEIYQEIDIDTIKHYTDFHSYKEHEFIEFTSNEALEYFKSILFIADYNQLKNQDISILKRSKDAAYIYQKFFERFLLGIDIFNSADVEVIEFEIEKYGHLIREYDEIIKYKQGKLKLEVPGDNIVTKEIYNDNVNPKTAYFLKKMINYNKREANHEKIYTR